MTDRREETLALRPDVVVTVLETGAVALDLATKYFYTVNPSGRSLLLLLEGGATRRRIQDRCAEWGRPESDVPRIEAFLQTLLTDGLVESSGTTGEPDSVDFSGPWSAPTVERQKEPLQRLMVSAFDPSIPLAE
jgi:hypothetical protein